MLPSIIISTEPDALLRFFPKYTPQRNTFTGLVFILTTEGEAIVEIDTRPYSLRPGTFLTLLPSHLLSTTMQGDDHRCLTLAFLFDEMTDYPYMIQSHISEQMEQTLVIRITSEEKEILENRHKDLTAHYNRPAHPVFPPNFARTPNYPPPTSLHYNYTLPT